MEFEDSKPADNTGQILAPAKKVTLQPLHDNIVPDEVPNGEAAIKTMSEMYSFDTTVANDTAVTRVQPSRSILSEQQSKSESKPKNSIKLILLAISTCSIVGIGLYLISR